MVEINSNDYHDFVIKNGKLVGEFDQMYQKSKIVPWNQDKQEDWLDVRVTLELLREFAPFNSIYDFGCGLGYFLNLLGRKYGKSGCKLVGYDISTTACQKAQAIFSNIEFIELDFTKDFGKIIREENEKRLFLLRTTLWYIFPKMQDVINNIGRMAVKGDFLLVSQNFPPLKYNFIGKKTISNPQDIIVYFGKYFAPLKTIWLENKLSKGNDNWFIGVFKKRK